VKGFMKRFRYGEKGFTLVELLVVIAIVGVLAAVVIPNVGRFIGRGRTESYAAELHNVQTAVMAMLTESATGELDAAVDATKDMETVLTDSGAKNLSQYLTGLGDDPDTAGTETTCVTSGCSYAFDVNGTVTQTTPQ